jgi:hypothetical protein
MIITTIFLLIISIWIYKLPKHMCVKLNNFKFKTKLTRFPSFYVNKHIITISNSEWYVEDPIVTKILDKVKSMSELEFLNLMIDSIENPVTNLDMHTFGDIRNNFCYGCLATNTICKLLTIESADLSIIKGRYFFNYGNMSRKLDGRLCHFESMIDHIRTGSYQRYINVTTALDITPLSKELIHYSEKNFTPNVLKRLKGMRSTLDK